MERLDVWCPNDDCAGMFQYKVETEDMGEGTEHNMACPYCGVKVYFEISYDPIVGNERLEP
jgi:hypothetical protein